LHPLLEKREKIKRVGIVLITSNRGLCGGFNASMINKIHKSIEKNKNENNIKTEFILIGKKGAAVHKYYNYNIVADFPKLDITTEVKEIIPLAKMILSDYLSSKYDKVLVAYTDFINTAKQIPRIKQLLPVDISTQDEYLGIVGENPKVGINKEYLKMKEEAHLSDENYEYEYTFEPSSSEVLNEMIPRLIEIQLYQALLESNASEHSARMNAMHQATEAAGDIVNELTLSYNNARQASITRELAEISAGANALAN